MTTATPPILKTYAEHGLLYAQSGDTRTLALWLSEHAQLIETHGPELLMRACEHGQDACAQQLLDAGVPVNACDSRGLTALDYAAKNSHWQIAETLLDAGAHPDGSPRELRHAAPTPLMYAARDGNFSMMYALEERGACIRYRDSKGQSLMHYAAQASEHGAQTVYKAMDMLHSPHLPNHTLANMKDKTGETPLHAAARARSVGAIEALIAAGADAQAANVIGQTPADLTHDAACLHALNPPHQGELLGKAGRSR